MFVFVSVSLFAFTLVYQILILEVIQINTSIFFDKKYMTLDLDISHEKMSDFVSFPVLGFTLVIKLRNLNLKVTEIL